MFFLFLHGTSHFSFWVPFWNLVLSLYFSSSLLFRELFYFLFVFFFIDLRIVHITSLPKMCIYTDRLFTTMAERVVYEDYTESKPKYSHSSYYLLRTMEIYMTFTRFNNIFTVCFVVTSASFSLVICDLVVSLFFFSCTENPIWAVKFRILCWKCPNQISHTNFKYENNPFIFWLESIFIEFIMPFIYLILTALKQWIHIIYLFTFVQFWFSPLES